MGTDMNFAQGLWDRIYRQRPPHVLREVAVNERVARAGDPLDTVYVPRTAVILIARQSPLDSVPLTVGLIGPEGLVGWPALLRIPRWSHDAIGLVAGEVAAIRSGDLHAACAANYELADLLFAVAHNHTLQLAQSVVANLGHSLERRLARWLAMLDDRSATDVLVVTHDQLAQLLNVRRATVTDALHVLEGEQLIRNTRGRVTVRDRAGLRARAMQSYGLSEGDYRANIGPLGKVSAD